jgi:biofilm PGA synthesis N-glycosyltransferase PgaC
MARILSLILLSVFTITIFVLYYIDYKTIRPKHKNPKISFIIPCYNDGHLVKQCIESIYASYDKNNLELIVVNDCSKDNSAEVIQEMQKVYDFVFINLPQNGGKSDALNHASKRANYDIISFIDADAEINPVALNDVLDRFEMDPKI